MKFLLSKERITGHLQNDFDYLNIAFGLKSIGLFGSVRTGSPSQESDTALAAAFSRPIGLRFVELAEHLEKLPGIRVVLLTPKGIEGIRNQEILDSIRSRIGYV